MRDIKFRAWIKEEEIMTYFEDESYILNGDMSVDEFNYDKSSCQHFFEPCYKTVDAELMQYTGLKDKNGKEIYEGDICSYIGSDGKGDISYPYSGEQRSYVGEKIVIDRYQSMIIGRHISTYKKSINFSAPNGIINGWEIIKPYDLWNHQGWIEVIGNVWEDSDLLNDSKNTKSNYI